MKLLQKQKKKQQGSSHVPIMRSNWNGKRALDDMKQEMISIASAMAGKVVAASIDTSVQDELIEETLKEMGEQTWLS